MTKKELRDGDRLTLRNGEQLVYFEEFEGFGNLDTAHYNSEYNIGLTSIEYERYDIVKVERIQFTQGFTFMANYMAKEYIDENLSYQTIWERKEKIEPLNIKHYYRKEEFDNDRDFIIAKHSDKLNELTEVINKEVLK